jgi:hypothetical protein
MPSYILSFRPDPEERDAWIAELDCGHTQHERHQPPFQERPWVLTPEGRARFIGFEVECRRCEDDPARGGGGSGHRLIS